MRLVCNGFSSDPDVVAFLTASGITDVRQILAIDYLVNTLKDYSLWTKFYFIYPFIGGTAGTHKWNLKNPVDSDAAFRLTFGAGTTHSSGGVTPSLSTSFAQTYFTPSTCGASLNSGHLSFYSRTQSLGSEYEIGSSATIRVILSFYVATGPYSAFYNALFGPAVNNVVTTGLRTHTRTASNVQRFYLNGSDIGGVNSPSDSLPTTPIYIFSVSGTATNSTKQCAFASMGTGLNATENLNLYNTVQQYQRMLGRAV